MSGGWLKQAVKGEEEVYFRHGLDLDVCGCHRPDAPMRC